MKTREDFVTNSSSSSFIIAFNQADKNIYEIIEILEKASHSDTYPADYCYCDEDFDTFFFDLYGYDSIEEMIEDSYEEILINYGNFHDMHDSGLTIAYKDVGYSDEPVREALRRFSAEERIKYTEEH